MQTSFYEASLVVSILIWSWFIIWCDCFTRSMIFGEYYLYTWINLCIRISKFCISKQLEILVICLLLFTTNCFCTTVLLFFLLLISHPTFGVKNIELYFYHLVLASSLKINMNQCFVLKTYSFFRKLLNFCLHLSSCSVADY